MRECPGNDGHLRGAPRTPIARQDPPLRDWTNKYRHKTAENLLSLCLFFGFILIAPNIIYACRSGDSLYFSVFACTYLAIIALNLSKSLLGRMAYISLIAVFFIPGTYLVFRLGNISIGTAWICAATMLATLFFGMKGAVCAWATQALVFIAIGAAQSAGALSWREDPLLYTLSAVDGLGLGIITGAAQFYLIGGLRRSIEERGRLGSALRRRQTELAREAAGRHEAELRAEFLESHDPLTRLPNRENFELELARAVEVAAQRGRILGVMAVGLDRFKRVGETHGAGDAILIETADRLARSYRSDDVVARSGGDV